VSNKTLFIGLVSDRIDVMLCHGDRVTASRRIDCVIDQDPEKWGRSVKDAARHVRHAVDELAAKGLLTTVLYRSPTECSEHASMGLKSESDASEAALLSCADAFPCALDMTAHQAISVGRDARSNEPQTHVIVAADRDDAVSALASMVQNAGLKFQKAVPIAAAIIAGACQRLLQRREGTTSRLYVGDMRSFFVIAENGSIVFARAINLGVDALVTALTKPIRTSATEPCILDRKAACSILFTHGLPNRSKVVHESLGLLGGQIIPLLAPVLQRFIVELRQSLRFGVPENQRQSIQLVVEGPGGGIPGFVSLLASELSLQVNADEASQKFDWSQPCCAGSDLFEAMKTRRLLDRLGLQPNHIAQFRMGSRQRRWLWTGAAAALAVIAGEAWQVQTKILAIRDQAQTAATMSADQQELQGIVDRVTTAKIALTGLETIIARETAAGINLRACLQELASVATPEIRLTGIEFHQNGNKLMGTISGYAFKSEGSNDRPQLEPFIDLLRRSPLFESVVLSNVQMGALGEVAGQRFETTVVAVAAPRQLSPDQLANVPVASASSISTGVQP